MHKKKLLALLVPSLLALSACGGGGGGSGSPSASGMVTGVAAIGVPLANDAFVVYGQNATICAQGTTDSGGSFSFNSLPCGGDYAVVSVQNGKGSLVSLSETTYVSGTSLAQFVAVTPWTDAVMRQVLSQGGVSMTTASADAIAKELLANTVTFVPAIQQAGNNLAAQLPTLFPNPNGFSWSGFDPFHTPFSANHTGFDAILDQSAVSFTTGVGPSIMNTATHQAATLAGSGSVQVQTPSPTGVPYSNQDYYDINYLQPLGSTPATIHATDTQNGGQSYPAIGGTETTLNPDNLAQVYQWSSPAIMVKSAGSNPGNPYMPGALMFCQSVSGQGIGSNSQKSVDVLVTRNALPVTSPIQMANMVFSSYYEDCSEGDTIPPTTGDLLAFDGNGNLTAFVNNGTTQVSLTWAQVTQALTGTPVAVAGGYLSFNAYRYTSAYGVPRFIIVEHGGPNTGTLTRGFVGAWLG